MCALDWLCHIAMCSAPDGFRTGQGGGPGPPSCWPVHPIAPPPAVALTALAAVLVLLAIGELAVTVPVLLRRGGRAGVSKEGYPVRFLVVRAQSACGLLLALLCWVGLIVTQNWHGSSNVRLLECSHTHPTLPACHPRQVGDWGRDGGWNQSRVAAAMALKAETFQPQFIVSTVRRCGCLRTGAGWLCCASCIMSLVPAKSPAGIA